MARVHILYNAASDSGAFSGGSWVASLPLNNLKTAPRTSVARSVDLAAASTQFTIDRGADATWQLFAFVNHNFTAAATVRIQVATGLDATIGALTGVVIDTTQTVGSSTRGLFRYRHPSSQVGRYVRVEISDANNGAGYVQAGRFMAGMAWSPAVNFDYGAALSVVDETTFTRTMGGQLHFNVKPKYRRISLSFDALTNAEVFTGTPGSAGFVMHLLENRALHGNMIVIYDPDDTGILLYARMIYGRLASLAPITEVRPNWGTTGKPYTWSCEIEELL